ASSARREEFRSATGGRASARGSSRRRTWRRPSSRCGAAQCSSHLPTQTSCALSGSFRTPSRSRAGDPVSQYDVSEIEKLIDGELSWTRVQEIMKDAKDAD